MTSTAKRRLAVFALALGLIAAAPQLFHGFVDHSPPIGSGGRVFFIGRSDTPYDLRSLHLGFGIGRATYLSSKIGSVLSIDVLRGSYTLHLPTESITLRVVCAVALAGVWGLVVCGRWLTRRRHPEAA